MIDVSRRRLERMRMNVERLKRMADNALTNLQLRFGGTYVNPNFDRTPPGSPIGIPVGNLTFD